MKKVLCIVMIAGCFATACARKKIIGIEPLPTQQCLYSVEYQDSLPYTFIDSCGKYSVGDRF